MAHVLENLTSHQIRLIAADPLTDEGRALLHRISGADNPYRNLDEMFADEADPYGEGLQADFNNEQQRDDDPEDRLALAGDLSGGHWVTIDSEHVYIKGDTIESGHLAGKSIHEAHESIAKGRDREAKNSRTEAKHQRKAGNEAEAQRHEHIAEHHEAKAAEVRKAAPLKASSAKSKAPTEDDILHEAHELRTEQHGHTGIVPTEELRGAVAKRFGAEHAGESFDKAIHGMKASDKVRDTGAGLTNFAEPTTESPYKANPGAVKESDIHSAIDHVAAKHADTGLAPIHEVREHIRQKLGDEAASHKNFDNAVMRMRYDDKVRATPISDGSRMTSDQLQKSIPGAGETFGYLSKSKN